MNDIEKTTQRPAGKPSRPVVSYRNMGNDFPEFFRPSDSAVDKRNFTPIIHPTRTGQRLKGEILYPLDYHQPWAVRCLGEKALKLLLYLLPRKRT